MGNINKMCKHNKPWFDDKICVISNTEVFQYVKLMINEKQLTGVEECSFQTQERKTNSLAIFVMCKPQHQQRSYHENVPGLFPSFLHFSGCKLPPCSASTVVFSFDTDQVLFWPPIQHHQGWDSGSGRESEVWFPL